MILLQRYATGDQGTLSTLRDTDTDQIICHCLELPWRENQRSISCIPAGTYEVRWHASPRFGPTYKVHEVPGRSEILFHAGNWAGDAKLGFKTDSNGCILPCLSIGTLEGQQAGLSSKVALAKLIAHCKKEPFLLTVKDILDVPST